MFLPFHLGPERIPDGPHGKAPPPPPEDEEFGARMFHKIAMIEKLQRKCYGIIFAEAGLHPAQGVCLKTVSLKQGLSQRELADELKIERATATVMLQKLEKAGFIERRPDPSDQRVTRIFITEKGEEANRHSDDECDEFIANCFAGMDSESGDKLAECLELIENNLFEFLKTHDKERNEPPI